MSKPKIYADFHDLDDDNRLRLTCAGTKEDLARQSIDLYEGLVAIFYMDDANEQGQPDELRALHAWVERAEKGDRHPAHRVVARDPRGGPGP